MLNNELLSENIVLLFILRIACHYIANIPRFMDSELSNCVNILTIFKEFRYLTIYKQPELQTNKML